ncbi:MAG: hypothetical protein IK118_01510 [Clostridia bacterium]|nr:hypothetical protein [Clostridia bacterium]
MKAEKIIAFALALILALSTFTAGIAFPVGAAENAVAAGKTGPAAGDYVYLGATVPEASYDGETAGQPIKWRVLDPAETNFGGKGVFLITEELLGGTEKNTYEGCGYILFNERSGPDDDTNRGGPLWEGSAAQSWCKSFYANDLTAQEQAAVLLTAKTDGPYEYDAKADTDGSDLYTVPFTASELKGDRVFFLSAEEVMTFFPERKTNPGRIAEYDGKPFYWWLRTPYLNFNLSIYSAGDVKPDGKISYDMTETRVAGARPAMNLDPDRILMWSAASDGKPQAADGKLAALSRDTSEWKAMLLDESLSLTVDSDGIVKNKNTVSIPFSNATTGEGCYVSAAVKDDDGRLLYYAKCADLSSKSDGVVKLDVSKVGKNHLYLFCERENTDFTSDYGGAMQEIPLSSQTVAPPETDVQDRAAPKTGDYVYLGSTTSEASYDGVTFGQPIQWRILDLNETNFGEPGVFLITEELLGGTEKYGVYGYILFNEYDFSTSKRTRERSDVEWQGSLAQGWCKTFYADNLTAREQAAVLAATKTDEPFEYDPSADNVSDSYTFPIRFDASALEGEYVFFLSPEEAVTYFPERESINGRVAAYNGVPWVWWLRTPVITGAYDFYIGFVKQSGEIDRTEVRSNIAAGARPAMNLDPDRILMWSAASDGKPQSADGKLAALSRDTSEWKLTLLDESLSLTVDKTGIVKDGNTLTVPFSGATTGEGCYVSAAVKDDDGNVLCYAKAADLSSASEGVVTLDVSNVGDDHLYLFCERASADYVSDYGSAMQEIPLSPQSEPSTTEAPTTEVPTTEVPTTEAPTTEVPTTEAPTTEVPTTEAPTTEAPTTEAPTTEAPTSEAPTTEAPTTEAPTTEAPSHTEHQWDEGRFAEPDRDRLTAIRIYTCSDCGETKKEEIKYMLGDVDQSGKINSVDARLALRRAARIESFEENSPAFLACDVDCDSRVKATDARHILRGAAKLEDPETWGNGETPPPATEAPATEDPTTETLPTVTEAPSAPTEPSGKITDLTVKVRATAASKLKLVEKDTEAFTMQIPEGWELRYGWDGEKMLLIRVYDPENPVNQIFYATDMVPFMKSEAGARMYASTGPAMLSEAVVLDPPTNETLFKQIPKLRDYYFNTIKSEATAALIPEICDFELLEKLPASSAFSDESLDDSILHGYFKTADGGAEGECVGFASIVDLFGDKVATINGVDVSYYNVYNFTAITGVKDEFVNYEQTLFRSFASLKLKQEFVAKMLNNSEKSFEQMQQMNASLSASYDNYNSAWLARSQSGDIARQKQSDATLGYERVYDTETGEIYKAYNGFTDEYDGQRYLPITDDMYSLGWNGYIEKK